MVSSTPQELEGVSCTRLSEELRGPGVDYWKSWRDTDHSQAESNSTPGDCSAKGSSILDTIHGVFKAPA